jgi:hypothetical protein
MLHIRPGPWRLARVAMARFDLECFTLLHDAKSRPSNAEMLGPDCPVLRFLPICDGFLLRNITRRNYGPAAVWTCRIACPIELENITSIKNRGHENRDTFPIRLTNASLSLLTLRSILHAFECIAQKILSAHIFATFRRPRSNDCLNLAK